MGDLFSVIFFVSLFLSLVFAVRGFAKRKSSWIVTGIVYGVIVTFLGWMSIGYYLLLVPLVQVALLVKVTRDSSAGQFAGMLVGAVAVWGVIGYLLIMA